MHHGARTWRIRACEIHCNTLQHTATHCNTLQHTAAHCNTLQHTATHGNTLQHTATHCNTLQHTATHCITVRHTATHCNTLQHTATACNNLQHPATTHWTHCNKDVAPTCSVLWYTCKYAWQYNTLQHTATHYTDILQHTTIHCNTRVNMYRANTRLCPSNNYDCQNFQQVFTGVPIHIKHVLTKVPQISNKFSRE